MRWVDGIGENISDDSTGDSARDSVSTDKTAGNAVAVLVHANVGTKSDSVEQESKTNPEPTQARTLFENTVCS